jgi:hypothetical protein
VFATPKNLKLPGGFTPQPGKTYILGKNGTPRLIEVHTGGVPIDWQAWTSVLRIVLLVAIVAFVLAVIDRGLRNSRRRRVSS